MADKPNDRPGAENANPPAVDPKIYAVVNGEKFPRPSLETMFADADGPERVSGCACHPVVYCACNKVGGAARTETTTGGTKTCSCVGHSSCSCVGHRSGGVSYGCRCAPVH